MATLNERLPTLLDVIKRTDPKGAIFDLVETLSQMNPLLEDAVWVEGNLPTGHRVALRTALPSVKPRKFNQGVLPTKSKSETIDEACGNYNGRSAVDVKLAALNGNSAAFRASEDHGFMEALSNSVERGFFYNSPEGAPELFHGFAPRLDSTATPYGASQIVKCDPGASGNDQTSMWLVDWSPQTVFGIYPKGSKAGIDHKDMGEQLVDDGSGTGATFRAWVSDWNWDLGAVVRDYRGLVRIPNIDTGTLSGTGDNLAEAMIEAYYRCRGNGRKVFYCNRQVAAALHKQARSNVKQSTLSIEDFAGKKVLQFMGYPIRVTDGILSNEAVVI